MTLFFYFTVSADWCKRDIIPDRSLLREYPSVIKFVIGHRGDKNPVLKVYLLNDDNNAKLFFRNKFSEYARIEYVHIKSKERLDKIETIKFYEEKAPGIDAPTIKELKKIIQEHGDKIFARYSNVVGLKISNVRCDGDIKKDEPCIVLYCLDKTLIPFGENPLPESLGGWPCDIREDIVMLGLRCPTNCRNQNLPELGCSIGRPTTDGSGSVGFYYKSQIESDRFRCGFLTASHVALDCFEDLYDKSLLSNNDDLRHRQFSIYHPSREDCRSSQHIGDVAESFLGNMSSGSSDQSGLDIAVVESNIFADEGLVYFAFISKLINSYGQQ